MPRQPRDDQAGQIYHALNRGNQRQTIFHKEQNFFPRKTTPVTFSSPVFFPTLNHNRLSIRLEFDLVKTVCVAAAFICLAPTSGCPTLSTGH